MSKRITITIHDNIPDDVALRLVLQTVQQGRISHNSKGEAFYCWGMLTVDPARAGEDVDFEDFNYAVYTSSKSQVPNSAFHVMNYKHPDNVSES